MSSDRVLQDVAGGVLRLTLNRPDKRNAIDRDMVRALHAGLERADLDAAVRVVVLRGAGTDFCAGADLAELLESADQSAAENETHALQLGEIFIRLRSLPKPVVAVVHGRALAGGCGLASACDLVIAHAEAVFGYPEVRRGFVPAMVMAMLRRAVGEKVAMDLVLTGRMLSAEEARVVGLVSQVLEASAFDRDSAALVEQLAAGSPTAMALIKQQLYELDGRTFTEGVALGARVNATARSTADFKAAVQRFLDKR